MGSPWVSYVRQDTIAVRTYALEKLVVLIPVSFEMETDVEPRSLKSALRDE
jgi:hypothetical protein